MESVRIKSEIPTELVLFLNKFWAYSHQLPCEEKVNEWLNEYINLAQQYSTEKLYEHLQTYMTQKGVDIQGLHKIIKKLEASFSDMSEITIEGLAYDLEPENHLLHMLIFFFALSNIIVLCTNPALPVISIPASILSGYWVMEKYGGVKAHYMRIFYWLLSEVQKEDWEM